MAKKEFITDLTPGTQVDSQFVLAEKNLNQKRDGNAFLTIRLTDRTGSAKGVIWEQADQINAAIQIGDIVQVEGNANEYRGALQLVVKRMQVIPRDQLDPADFLPTTQHNPDAMLERLMALTRQVENPHLKTLFEAIWQDNDLVARFKTAPAAKMMHHAYVGGLLEHTLSMALLADKICGHYQGVNRDLLMAGVLFHDIGKIEEFSYQYQIDYTDEGRLISHMVLGMQLVNAKIRQIPDFPRSLAVQIHHMIISHHGEREYGAMEPPKTIEAVLLHSIDELDSKFNAVRTFIEADASPDPWTGYHRLLGRQLYKKAVDSPLSTESEPPETSA